MDTSTLAQEIATLFTELVGRDIDDFHALMMVQYYIQARVQFMIVTGENPGIDITALLKPSTGETQ